MATLKRALATGRVHHAYRFQGPPGVGKELTALALAQALLCERGGEDGCGSCSACHRAVTFTDDEPRVPLHPDVVLLGKGLYRSVLGSGSAETSGIGIEQVRRLVLERVSYGSHEGRALVFLVRDADEITPQAANALLKTLEEPQGRTHFVLLTARPNRLLDTIASRTLAVRFAPLPDDVVATILGKHGLDPAVAPLAQGSASLAIELADPDAKREREEFSNAALAAVSASDLTLAVKLAESQKKDREGLRAMLAFFSQELAREARQKIADDPALAERRAYEHGAVLSTLTALERNVQPALALEAMIVRLRGR